MINQSQPSFTQSLGGSFSFRISCLNKYPATVTVTVTVNVNVNVTVGTDYLFGPGPAALFVPDSWDDGLPFHVF